MHAIQALLMGAFSSLVLLTVLIFLGQALAEEVTIYDKDWRVKERIKDGTIYDKDWNMRERIKNGKIYDRKWNLNGRFDNERIYDRNWNTKGYIKKRK